MKKHVFYILFLAGSLQMFAQSDESTVHSFSVTEAMEYAAKNNLNTQNARLDVDAAQKRIWETAASGLPQVNATANYNNNLSLATTLIPDFFNNPSEKIEVQFGTRHFASAGLSASQLIFSGQYIIGLQTARLFREFSMKNLSLSEQQIKEAVLQSYYLVLLARNSLIALKGNLDNMETTFEETKEMYNAGFVGQNDVDQLEITLTDLQNAVASMERQVVATKNLLKYQMGLELDDEIHLTDSLSVMVESLEYQSLMSINFDVRQNLNYQILSDQENLALMDLKAKRTEFMPTLSAFFSLDYTAQRDEFNFFDTNEDWYEASAIGLSLNIPLFSSGMRTAGLAQKKIEYEKAKNSKNFTARGLEVEFIQAKYDLANAYEQFKRDEKNLKLTRKVSANTNTSFNEGLATSLELTQVNDQYLQTLSNYTSSMVEFLNAKMKLDVLMNNL